MIRNLLIGFWPFWYPVAFAAGFFVVACLRRLGGRRLAKARRSLSEREVALAGRPSPAPIDVELMR